MTTRRYSLYYWPLIGILRPEHFWAEMEALDPRCGWRFLPADVVAVTVAGDCRAVMIPPLVNS